MTSVSDPAPGTVAPQAATAAPAAAKPAPDPRYLALRNFAVSITVLNIFGYTILGFEQPYLWPILAVLTAYVADLTLETLQAWGQHRRPEFLGKGARGVYVFLLPAHITALAVNMLLYANNQWWPVMFGVLVGVGSKYVLRAPINGRMRHFMNPSNLGITVTLLSFSSWVSIAPPYQFTEYANTEFRMLIPMLILTAGTVMNAMLTKKIMLIMGWVGGFVIESFVRHWVWHSPLYSSLGMMSGVAFVLYTNYMVTDPGTTPSRPRALFMFGAMVSTVYGVLMVGNIVYTLFFATTIVCGLRGLGWWVAHFVRGRRERAMALAGDAGGGASAVAA